ncbi:MAG: 30S ribosomal protein S9 [Nanoarchaeota archaeon]
MKTIHVVGKRKSAVARATLNSGVGIVRVNSKLLTFYEPEIYRTKIQEPLILAGDVAKKVNININVEGGGINSQSDAARLAVARALAEHDKSLHKIFLDYDRTLTVADVRRKETHKPNRHGKARSKIQKSYR